MKRIGFISLLLLCLLQALMVTGQPQQAGELLSRAIYLEEINGELE